MSTDSSNRHSLSQELNVGGNFEVSGQNNYVDASLKQYIQEIHEEYKLITPESVITNFNPEQIESPYKALESFDVYDEQLFQGRTLLIRELLQACESSNLLLVLGASGSGKSSVVRAGLIPKFLKQDRVNRHYFLLTPGQNPFKNLRNSLEGRRKALQLDKLDFGDVEERIEFVIEGTSSTFKRIQQELIEPGKRWLIFIDQFEQLFTDCQDLSYRRSFIDSITEIAQSRDSSLTLVLAMRADFLEQFTAYPQFGRIAQKNIHLLAEMYPEELEMAIKWPAAQRGVVFQTGLVPLIVSQLQGKIGTLPLLQYTLHLLWEYECQIDSTGQRGINDYHLNTESYNALGGVRGALQTHVEEVYTQRLKTSAQQEVAKQIFLKLVQWISGERGQYLPVSRRRLYSDFKTGIEAETLQVFIQERLIVSSADNLSQEALQDNLATPQKATVEIAHEILLSAWQRLKGWIEEAKDVLIAKSQLQADMARYAEVFKENEAKANDELLMGSRLERILELWDDGMFELRNIPLDAAEVEFIEQSVEWRDKQLQKEREINETLKAQLIKIQFGEKARKIQYDLSLKGTIEQLIKAIALTAEIFSTNSKYFDTTTANLVAYALFLTIDKVRERNVLGGHIGGVSAIAFHPDGQRIISGSWDCIVRLWNVDSGQLLHTFEGHADEVRAIAFSPDGQQILSGSRDKTVRLWDVDSGQLLHTFEGHAGEVRAIAFSPDGQQILSGSDDKTVQLWDVDSGQLLRSFEGHTGGVTGITFSPDGQQILSNSWDKIVRLWDVGSGQLLHTFEGHIGAVGAIAFSPDGQQILSGSDDKTVRLWEVDSGQLLHTFEGDTTEIAFSPDGQRIVSGGDDFTVRLWDRDSGQLLDTFEGHTSYIRAIALSSDGQRIVSGGDDFTVRLWDRNSGQLLRIFEGYTGYVTGIAFSADGQQIISGGNDFTVRLWDRNSGQLLHIFEGHTGYVGMIAFSPDNQKILSGSSVDQTVRLWDRNSGQLLHIFEGHTSYISAIAFSPNGLQILSGSDDKIVRLWDVDSGQLLRSFEGHTGEVKGIAFSPDGQQILSGSWDNTVRLWDVGSGQLLHTFEGHTTYISAIAFNPNGQQILSHDHLTARLWDKNSGQLLHIFKHPNEIRAIAFSPDGQQILSCSEKTIRLWDVDSGELLHTFEGHTSYIRAIAFSPDGTQVLSSSPDCTIRLWDIASGQLLHIFKGHTDLVDLITFSPDGTQILSGAFDGTMRLWRALDSKGLLQGAAERLRYHPALRNPETEEAKQACAACQKYVWKPKADELNQQGLDKFKAKAYQEAIQFFSEAIDYNPEHIEVYYYRGRSYVLMQDFEKAYQDFSQAINLIKSQLKTLNTFLYHAVIFQPNKKRKYTFNPFFVIAEKYLTAIYLLQSKTNLADVYFYRGWSYSKLRSLQQAKTDWQAADKIYEMQMANSANAKKVKEFMNHPSITNLAES